MRLEALELVDDLEEGERPPLAAARLHRELARIFAFAIAHLDHVLERDAELLGDEKFGAGEHGARGAGDLDRQHHLLGNLRHRHQGPHLAHRLDLARHADQGDPLVTRIAQQLQIGGQAIAGLAAADHLVFAVGDHGRGHPGAVGVTPDDDHRVGEARA